jgi:hypothetical protein
VGPTAVATVSLPHGTPPILAAFLCVARLSSPRFRRRVARHSSLLPAAVCGRPPSPPFRRRVTRLRLSLRAIV